MQDTSNPAAHERGTKSKGLCWALGVAAVVAAIMV